MHFVVLDITRDWKLHLSGFEHAAQIRECARWCETMPMDIPVGYDAGKKLLPLFH